MASLRKGSAGARGGRRQRAAPLRHALVAHARNWPGDFTASRVSGSRREPPSWVDKGRETQNRRAGLECRPTPCSQRAELHAHLQLAARAANPGPGSEPASPQSPPTAPPVQEARSREELQSVGVAEFVICADVHRSSPPAHRVRRPRALLHAVVQVGHGRLQQRKAAFPYIPRLSFPPACLSRADVGSANKHRLPTNACVFVWSVVWAGVAPRALLTRCFGAQAASTYESKAPVAFL